MRNIRCYRDLRVWQAAMNLAEGVYKLSKSFPNAEMYGLAAQMRRSAVSIPSNIAEGHTRESRREYLRHLSIGQGSLAELETQLEISARLQYISVVELKEALESTSSIGNQLYTLRNALLRKDSRRSPVTDPRPPTPGPRPPARGICKLCKYVACNY
jgi:four helix bundle protein